MTTTTTKKEEEEEATALFWGLVSLCCCLNELFRLFFTKPKYERETRVTPKTQNRNRKIIGPLYIILTLFSFLLSNSTCSLFHSLLLDFHFHNRPSNHGTQLYFTKKKRSDNSHYIHQTIKTCCRSHKFCKQIFGKI